MIAGGLLPLAALAAGQGLATCPKEIAEPVRAFSGVYVDAFENQRFYEGARILSDIRGKAGRGAWMSFDVVGEGARFGIKRRTSSYAYRIRFDGVRRAREPYRFPCGYGHMNGSASAISLTRLIAIEPLGTAVRPDHRR